MTFRGLQQGAGTHGECLICRPKAKLLCESRTAHVLEEEGN